MEPEDFEAVSALGKEIGTTIHRLTEVLLVRNVITKEDTQYIRNKMSRADWLKEATKSPMDLFMEMLSGASEHNPFQSDKKEGDTDAT